MSGHSKWKTNKGKKMAADAIKGKTYTKVIKEITIAARAGGGNPDMNPALRTAISRAREANMPADNVKMAIKRGTGELPGVIYETVMYEGFGPGGVALLIEATTDNKNRSTAEIRHCIFRRPAHLTMAGAGIGKQREFYFHTAGFQCVNLYGHRLCFLGTGFTDVQCTGEPARLFHCWRRRYPCQTHRVCGRPFTHPGHRHEPGSLAGHRILIPGLTVLPPGKPAQ